MTEMIWSPLSQDDTDGVFALTSNPDVAEYMRFDTHKSREEAADLIRQYTEEGNYGYRIGNRDHGQMMGVAALKRGEEEGEYSVSIFIAPEYWNQGYSTLAVMKLKQIAAEHGIRYLSAYVVEENIGSRRIMEKCGFEIKKILHFEDMTSGLYVYGIQLS